MTTIEDARGIWGPLAEPVHRAVEFGSDRRPWRENSFLCCHDREQDFYCTAHIQGGMNARAHVGNASPTISSPVAHNALSDVGSRASETSTETSARSDGTGLCLVAMRYIIS